MFMCAHTCVHTHVHAYKYPHSHSHFICFFVYLYMNKYTCVRCYICIINTCVHMLMSMHVCCECMNKWYINERENSLSMNLLCHYVYTL